MLEKVFDEVILVDVLDSGDSAHLALMKRSELGVTLTKLHCWELTQFSKCVFMDADTMVSGYVPWYLITWYGSCWIFFLWVVLGFLGGGGEGLVLWVVCVVLVFCFDVVCLFVFLEEG